MTANGFASTWQDVLGTAGENSNSIKSAGKQSESSRWSWLRSYGNFLPQISGNASVSQTTTASQSANSSYSYGLSASQSLFSGLSNYFNLQSAFTQYSVDQANLDKARSDAFYDARVAYINLLIGQENLKLQSQILDRRQLNERMIKLRYEGGKEDKGNLMQNEAYLADAEHSLSSARRQLRLAQLKLSQLIESDVSRVEGTLEVTAPSTPEYSSLLNNSPSYIISKYQLELADLNNRSSVSGYLPDISLQGSYRKSGNSWPPDSENKSLSLNLSYSLFPGGTNIIDSAINSAKLDKAREDFAQSHKSTLYNMQSAYENLIDAIEALKVRYLYLSAAKEREAIAQAKYLNGLMTYTDWDLIESQYISAQQSLISAQKSALAAEADWCHSYGGYIK